MINEVELGYFKCFERMALPVSSLTVLSGTNASGKSSVFQSLVLLRQTMRVDEWSKRLYLNGVDLELGTVMDVVDKVHGRFSFEIALSSETDKVHWNFDADKKRDGLSIPIDSLNVNGTMFDRPFVDSHRLQFLVPETVSAASITNQIRNLTYLTAERTGPRPTYELQDNEVAKVVGPRGDNAIGILYQNRDKVISENLAVDPKPATLLSQVGNRMRQFFDNSSIDVQRIQRTNLVTLGIRTSEQTDHHRPTHVGFGLTQTLPVIIACLNASPGDLLLIENPEVHLHPSGQAMMGEFLAAVSACGVQVMVETHSDHVLNGVRRAVKKSIAQASDVVIHFFQNRERNESQVISPTINDHGEISHWPMGFFDQFDKDLNYFAGWGE